MLDLRTADQHPARACHCRFKTEYAAVLYHQRQKNLTDGEKKLYNQGQHLVRYAKVYGSHRELCEMAGISVRTTKTSSQKAKNTTRKTTKKAIQQLNMQKRLLNTFVSISEAARKTDLKNSNISACCNEKKPSADGFIWQFG